MIQPKVGEVHLAEQGLRRRRWFSHRGRMRTHQDKIFTSGDIADERIFATDIKVFTCQNRMRTHQGTKIKYSPQEIYQMRDICTRY